MTIRINMIAGAVLAIGLAAPAVAQDDPTAETVVARVNDTEITLGHMIAIRARLPEQFQQMPDESLFEGILDQLVEQAALADSTDGAFDLRTRILLENTRREIIANSLLSATADGAVDDEAIEALYAERYLDAEPALEYNAAHILVESEDEAIVLRADIEDGADFAALATEHSIDPGSGPNGGDLGWFGLGTMVPAFEEAVIALEPGTMSEPFESQFGWHLLLLNETREAEAPELDAVREELTREVQQQAVIAHIERAREAATVEMSAEGIDPALLRDQTLLQD